MHQLRALDYEHIKRKSAALSGWSSKLTPYILALKALIGNNRYVERDRDGKRRAERNTAGHSRIISTCRADAKPAAREGKKQTGTAWTRNILALHISELVDNCGSSPAGQRRCHTPARANTFQ
eukprot:IDg7744t1